PTSMPSWGGATARIPPDPHNKDRHKRQYVSPHAGQHGCQRRRHRRWREKHRSRGPRNFRHGAARGFRRKNVRRAAGAQGVCALAHRSGAIVRSATMKKMLRTLSIAFLAAAALWSADTVKTPAKKTAFDKATLEAYVRHLNVWGPAIKVGVGDPKPSPVPGFQ